MGSSVDPVGDADEGHVDHCRRSVTREPHGFLQCDAKKVGRRSAPPALEDVRLPLQPTAALVRRSGQPPRW